MFQKGDLVSHPQHGVGRVWGVDGETVMVQFEAGPHLCLATDLQPLTDPAAAVDTGAWDPPADIVVRLQAEAIRSVSDAWGVLSRSRIELLPHQLWVARQVLRNWPSGWLVADDVGLGKTIEAGLILQALISKGEAKRILILCPAALDGQWEFRLRDMFDLRFALYAGGHDTDQREFWGGEERQVIASLQTLRRDHRGRRERLLEADPWDVLVVDEAHHLGAEEDGETLGYELVRQLREAGRVRSLLAFTGTPHRGDPYRFLALMALVRPDLFDPDRPAAGQLSRLGEALIRNNKQTVTDLHGNRLFRPQTVSERTFVYTPAEARFYDTLTAFLRTGRAYADQVGGASGSTANLVLTALQKLASSSVAAIRRALRNRLAGLVEERTRKEARRQRRGLPPEAEADADNRRDEAVAANAGVRLARGEEGHLQELLALADAVTEESRIAAVLALLDDGGPFAGRQVLLFTEYLATQAVLLEALARRHGSAAVTFINGPGAVEEWTGGGRHGARTWKRNREQAADDFNGGRGRFLVSTEAGGEGIDLQENCHSLVHVDLPWNPMRLHQRVGRLNRYGQKHPVEVYLVRNPDTIEGRVWEQLEDKLRTISRELAPGMDDPEDLLQLVLGMADPQLFDGLYAGADSHPTELKTWLTDRLTGLGGAEAREMVLALVGGAAHFDYTTGGADLPRLDLGALEPFLRRALQRHGIEPEEGREGLSFATPQAWRQGRRGARASYDRMLFQRDFRGRQASQRVLGVGHRVVDAAVEEGRKLRAAVAVIPKEALSGPLAVFRVTDEVTGSGAVTRATVFGVAAERAGVRVLRDWELLLLLNRLPETLQSEPSPAPPGDRAAVLNALRQAGAEQFAGWGLPYIRPHLELVGTLWPSGMDTSQGS